VDRADGVRAALSRAAATGRPVVRAWRPEPRVAFGPRDRRAAGYDAARAAARARGYAPVERSVGGRAVAYTGRTVAFVRATPEDGRPRLDDRYDRALGRVAAALRGLGARLERGEPAAAFCPGSHSLRAAGGGKVAGVAQRVRADAAAVAGCVLVDDRHAQRRVLAPVYEALGPSLDPEAVGDLSSAGASAGPGAVARAVAAALAAGGAEE
jgi:lipoate-protein ligase A